ncbi:hypothetical protein FPOAC1_010447 [Fusarium poae]|uniref:hypothetical protein n=1 Tax=Fusarium poae TaxID=36050 RepID=UPI001CE9CEDD|nr:hypothetical protein FPOAC1_010447 [Fusarium poae]KAG8665648.1 hypothetical protein FPOAC1_010447 [Fusarium poae]
MPVNVTSILKPSFGFRAEKRSRRMLIGGISAVFSTPQNCLNLCLPQVENSRDKAVGVVRGSGVIIFNIIGIGISNDAHVTPTKTSSMA